MGLTGVRSGSKTKDPKAKFLRKLEKKLNFINKVQDAIAKKTKSKVVQKKKLRTRQRKLKAYDLSDLSQFLPDLETLSPKTSVTKEEKINCKSRQTLVQRETTRMQAVLKDASFMKDPFEAIHKRLLERHNRRCKKTLKTHLKGRRRRRKRQRRQNQLKIWRFDYFIFLFT